MGLLFLSLFIILLTFFLVYCIVIIMAIINLIMIFLLYNRHGLLTIMISLYTIPIIYFLYLQFS